MGGRLIRCVLRAFGDIVKMSFLGGLITVVLFADVDDYRF